MAQPLRIRIVPSLDARMTFQQVQTALDFLGQFIVIEKGERTVCVRMTADREKIITRQVADLSPAHLPIERTIAVFYLWLSALPTHVSRQLVNVDAWIGLRVRSDQIKNGDLLLR